MSWRVATSLDVLLGEINAAAPNRSKLSDGAIGDAAHATRTSDHNPWVTKGGQGIVRARDFTHDPKNGLDGDVLADRLAALLLAGSHPALGSGAYIIWEGRILSFDRRREGWRAYTGSNPHTKHLHLSVTTDPAGFDSTKAWGVMAAPKPARKPKAVQTRGPLVDHALEDLTARRRKAKDPAVRRTLRKAKLLLQSLKSWPRK